ncbi:hypothetical protein [Paenibacillus sp. D9]|uniref:hypothetical protein n=1 Tax=Paenibacillus TaxID=44249 RepID=UPI00061FB016|nr:hypothetical protein [Paenibacillus sp. D9]KKC46252.1 hypothetical protein VE23_02570 [Paenibacillus sp. D9]
MMVNEGTLGRRAEGRKWRGIAGAAAAVMLAASLSGCMYPRERMAESQAPSMDVVAGVQAVVDLYQQKKGLLPIKNATQETPVYEKFVIDFPKLQRENFMSDLPAASFEKGGSYYFLIQNEEKDPTVKLMPLTIFQAVNDVQGWVDQYGRSHGGSIPAAGEAYPGYSRIDFKKLGQKEPSVRSLYSGGALTFMLSDKGRVYADYGSDMMRFVQKRGLDKVGADLDLRQLLAEDTDFVPVKSPPYKLVNGEPAAQPE